MINAYGCIANRDSIKSQQNIRVQATKFVQNLGALEQVKKR